MGNESRSENTFCLIKRKSPDVKLKNKINDSVLFLSIKEWPWRPIWKKLFPITKQEVINCTFEVFKMVKWFPFLVILITYDFDISIGWI